MIENMKKENIRKRCCAVYYTALMLPFFWQMPLLLGLSVAFPIQEVFRPLLLCVMGMAVSGLWLTRDSAGKGISLDAALLAAQYGWMIVVFLLHRHVLNEASLILLRAAIAWLAFYPFGFLLNENEKRKGITVISLCWIAVMTFLAVIGLYCAVREIGLENLSGNLWFGMLGSRLMLGVWATSTSENLLTAWLVAGALLFVTRRKWLRIPILAAMAILFVAMALTDGRNGIISIGLSVGAVAFVALMHNCGKRKIVGFCAGICAAALCVVMVYGSSIQIQKFFSGTYRQVASMRQIIIDPFLRGGAEETQIAAEPETVPEAPAPEQTTETSQAPVSEPSAPAPAAMEAETVPETTAAPKVSIRHRKIEASMNGRKGIWMGALEAFRKNEDNILLLGRPGSLCLETFRKNPRFLQQAEHLHNIYLQVLAEWGIVGAGIMAAFLVLFVIAAFRLVFQAGLPVWMRMLPIPAAVILASELADAFTRFGQDNVAVYVLFLFMGLTISQSRLIRRK